MPDQPTREEIAQAVKDSGYLMEQELGSELEALGFVVQTNYPYKDLDEAKSREIDVFAIRQSIQRAFRRFG